MTAEYKWERNTQEGSWEPEGHTWTFKCSFKRVEKWFPRAAAAAAAAAAKSIQLCPTLCNPIDGSSPGSSSGRVNRERLVKGSKSSIIR